MSNHVFTEDLKQEMGLMTSYRWKHEPRGVLFMLSRYKFVAKMVDGLDTVVEIGCGDGFGARLVRPVVGSLTCVDIDSAMIDSAVMCQGDFDIKFLCETTPIQHLADAIYSLDVIEHMPSDYTDQFIYQCSNASNMTIIGTPSIEFQEHASPLSVQNHVNCMTQPQLKAVMKKRFKHVLMFSMSDEIVHTGFSKMSCYNFAIGMN